MFVSGPDDVITCCAARAVRPVLNPPAMANNRALAVIAYGRQRAYVEAIKFPIFPNASGDRAPHAGAADESYWSRMQPFFPQAPPTPAPSCPLCSIRRDRQPDQANFCSGA